VKAKQRKSFLCEKTMIAFAIVYGIAVVECSASNLADPAVLIPPSRLSVGASYDLGGFTITNDSVPCMLNRFEARVSYSPFSFVNFGVDAGATQMEVAGDTTNTDTVGIFHGKYGFSGGGHLKLGTPFFFNDLMAAVGILHGTYFSSMNNAGSVYSGMDANGGVGLQFHIHDFGYITAGSSVYLIFGKNKSFSGQQGKYSNINNVRGWLAIDYFPTIAASSRNIMYISLELTVSPKATFDGRAPVQEMSVSACIGSITRKLYGQESETEWKP
jgi:hypothetical protein